MSRCAGYVICSSASIRFSLSLTPAGLLQASFSIKQKQDTLSREQHGRKSLSLSSIEFHRFGCSAVCWGCWQLALGPTAATVTPARAFLFFDSRILSNRPAEATPPNAQYDGFLLQQTLDLPSFLLQCHVQPLHRDATSIGSRGLFS